MNFADNLRTARKEKNISQEDLAEMLNVSRQAVSKWEQGEGFPEADKLLPLAKALNISLDYLMGGADDDEPQAQQPSAQGSAPANRILIKSQDEKTVVNCYKVFSAQVSTKEDAPQYALFGVDGSSLLDEHRVFLGWYAREDTVNKEIDAIFAAMKRGTQVYELQHTAKVNKKFFSVKLADE